MCRPISLILTEDKVFLPPYNVWDHRHSFIMEKNNIPNGLIGDKYLRLEVTPPEEIIFRDEKTNEKLEVDNSWKVFVDEENIPDWYFHDKPNQEDRAREAAKKWFQNFPDNLMPRYREIAGDYATIIAANEALLTAGIKSTLNAGFWSELTAGSYSSLTAKCNSKLISGDNSTLNAGSGSRLISKNCSTLIAGSNSRLTADSHSSLFAGNSSTLIAGYNSALIAYDNSIFCAGKGSRFILHWNDGEKMRTTTAYVGEDGIKPNTEYLGIDGKFTEVKG